MLSTPPHTSFKMLQSLVGMGEGGGGLKDWGRFEVERFRGGGGGCGMGVEKGFGRAKVCESGVERVEK